MGLAAYVDWTMRPPLAPPEPDPFMNDGTPEEWQQYEDRENARLAPEFNGAALNREIAIADLLGHAPVSSPARSSDFRVVGEISRRHEWTRERVWPPAPLSAAALKLERRLHLCGLNCYAQGCRISGLPDPRANTTTDAGTSRAEDVSAMRR
jgi:hypothetical protein